ncbi:hypothetical protein [Pseudorhodoferax sp.]|uniref:hypothetical protein n=1 Tax=Pseudorhodoferax sp. TaxID=1993553 RepID=UPI002DD675AB|nr:hypothetical protein [Pseudorhodoferax sp.]
MLNLLTVQPGQHIRLRNGALCEVVENIGDGIWLQARVVEQDGAPAPSDEPELVHCEDIAGLEGGQAGT